jgi:hypothetical protein
MRPVNQEFQSAPAGWRIVGTVVFIFASIFAAIGIDIAFAFNALHAHSSPKDRAALVLAPLVGLLIVLPVFFFQRSRVARFRIEENCLVVGRKRYPLEGLADAARDPKIMSWAFKIAGNDGLGAIRGRYWSKRVGKFEAFLTDPEKAVVLRWPGRTVAVSPEDPEFFIMCAKSAAGLK